MTRLNDRKKEYSKGKREFRYILIGILIGFIGILLFASKSNNILQLFSIIGVAFMISSASILSGGLIGFLFGIPRTLQHNRGGEIDQASNIDTSQKKDVLNTTYQQNTNLEQISDWLTKIMVGVGLTQISEIPKAIKDYASYSAVGLGNFPESEIFSMALLLYFLIGGFLGGYLLTRLNLLSAFAEADLVAKLSQVESSVLYNQL